MSADRTTTDLESVSTDGPAAVVRVLLADDSASLRRLLTILLEELPGVTVVAEAADGREAVRLAAEQQPDLAFVDIGMPVLDGIEALPLIRACSPSTRLVTRSAYPRDELAPEALAAGAEMYLEKFAPDDELLAAVRSMFPQLDCVPAIAAAATD